VPVPFGVGPLIKGVVVGVQYQCTKYRLIRCSWGGILVLLAVQAKTRDFIRMLMLGAYTMEAIPSIAVYVADLYFCYLYLFVQLQTVLVTEITT
jgi:hypothetical protein